jgi:hypothetical protein
LAKNRLTLHNSANGTAKPTIALELQTAKHPQEFVAFISRQKCGDEQRYEKEWDCDEDQNREDVVE